MSLRWRETRDDLYRETRGHEALLLSVISGVRGLQGLRAVLRDMLTFRQVMTPEEKRTMIEQYPTRGTACLPKWIKATLRNWAYRHEISMTPEALRERKRAAGLAQSHRRGNDPTPEQIECRKMQIRNSTSDLQKRRRA